MDIKDTSIDRTEIVDRQFKQKLQHADLPDTKACAIPENTDLVEVFTSQVASRHLDFIARKLRQANQGFYTIGSSGHEGNAALALAFKTQDQCLLHYRSCAFMLQRAKLLCGDRKLYNHILAMVAAKSDPISQGRHKVFGDLELNVPPQTSTIGSHLPKAFGSAFGIVLGKELKLTTTTDAVVACSFGDASFNHSTVQGALQAIRWTTSKRIPLPLVLICEDNGIGISTPTEDSWILNCMQDDPWITYYAVNGLNILEVQQVADNAVRMARVEKRPVFIHLKTVRLMGHAGSDIETQYRDIDAIKATEANDPLLYTASILIKNNILNKQQILDLYQDIGKQINDLASQAILEEKLTNKQQILQHIVPKPKKIPPLKIQVNKKYCTLAQAINQSLQEMMELFPEIVVFGQDVGKKGGVYRVTEGLQKKFGPSRVFDTMLDEQTIIGTAIGLSQQQILPIAEIQFLAYIHNAIDQLRGEAATQSFFSSSKFVNPLIIRIPSFAYQSGIGGHFHNDNSIAFLREIPGIVILCPSRARTATSLLRKAVLLAKYQHRVVVILEPIARYFTKDLYQSNDKLWMDEYPDFHQEVNLDTITEYGDDPTFTIITYGNGLWLSLQAVAKLDINIKVIDLQCLHPLPEKSLLKSIAKTKKLLIVDECRRTGSLSEALITFVNQQKLSLQVDRVTAEDSFIPQGPAAELILPSVAGITEKLLTFLELES